LQAVNKCRNLRLVKTGTKGMKTIRVRFAPSPTGPLHIGGVRTALYNYLFARKHGGKFILRIEDTDQNRYVEGAEDYIRQSLNWLGLSPDEGPVQGGDYGPYRQSERKHLYKEYAEKLIEAGHAYYAFDSAEELQQMREDKEKEDVHSAKYDQSTRLDMKNSLSLSAEETDQLLMDCPHTVVRLKVPEGETISFDDKVRKRVSFNSSELDDKVILKADGMPTYHLANIVDDHLMEISHVIRGEEWLSSTAHHILMYRFLGWEPPVFTHLPLLLKPSGKGKLSKRDGSKFGFPVFPMEWDAGDEKYSGFKEEGYDPAALVNFLVLLGWHPSDDTEILDKETMAELFELGQIVKSGARFDIEKALWFNQQYIMSFEDDYILEQIKDHVPESIFSRYDEWFLKELIRLMKPRARLYGDFYTEARYLYEMPDSYDEKQVVKRISSEVMDVLEDLKNMVLDSTEFNAESLSAVIKGHLSENALKMGVYLPLIRIMMCGAMTGPDLFEIFALLGKASVIERWDRALEAFRSYL